MNPPDTVQVLDTDGKTPLFRCSNNKAHKLVHNGLAEWVERKSKHRVIKAKFSDLRSSNMIRPITADNYGSCRVLSPQGTIMFLCSERRINWYLKRGIATKTCNDPLTIQLLFEPNGPGNTDPYYVTVKENKCVVCGTQERLSKHHVVPSCYRQHFPQEIKSHSCHDVLRVCALCHDQYEVYAQELKLKLAKEHDDPLQGPLKHDRDLLKVKQYAKTLLSEADSLPAIAKEKLLAPLRVYFKKEAIEEADILVAVNIDTMFGEGADFGYRTVQAVDLESFVKMWRQHFIDTMRPQHMPALWDVQRSIYREEFRDRGEAEA